MKAALAAGSAWIAAMTSLAVVAPVTMWKVSVVVRGIVVDRFVAFRGGVVDELDLDVAGRAGLVGIE